MIYDISDELYEKCVKFANDRIGLSKHLYSYRGESNTDKMVEDIVIGTLGEWAIYLHLSELGYEVGEPDMEIYTTRRKSFSADLFFNDIKLHVKSQGIVSAKRYGNSWLLQRSDKIIANPSDKDMYAFTNVDISTKKVTILGYCWCNMVKYDECKVPKYRSTKVAIYVDQIQDQLIQL